MASPIRIETAQVIELAGISSDKLRYWKDALPPIKGRDGRKDGYSFAEAVAIAAIALAMRRFGLDISRFSDSADSFFDQVDQLLRHPSERAVLQFNGDDWHRGYNDSEAALHLGIGRIARRLRENLTQLPEHSTQLSFL